MKINKTTIPELNYEGFEDDLLYCHVVEAGLDSHNIQYIFRFANNLGASVIKSSFSYGSEEDLWEFAPVTFEEDGTFKVCGETVGFCQDSRIRVLLEDVKSM